MHEKIYVVDAFTSQPFSGNPAGVVLLEENHSDEWMLSVAREVNLSETAFILGKSDPKNLRWFTPTVEVPLCGHATLAAAHVLYSCNLMDSGEPIRFATLSGLIECQHTDDWIWMAFPAFDCVELKIDQKYVDALKSQPHKIFKTGVNLMAVYQDASEVIRADPDMDKISLMDAQGIIITSRFEKNSIDFISRYFAPKIGIDEDPVTGSSHCSLAPYWGAILEKEILIAEQVSKRGGILKLKNLGDKVVIGGQAQTVFSGNLLV